MGIYDRDYIREEPEGITFGGPWTAVGTIVVINVVIYLLDHLSFSVRFNDYLRLNADLFVRLGNGEIWEVYRLLTHGFAHSDAGIMHIAMNMLGLWFLGRDVEAIYGKKLFWQLYLSTILLAGLSWVLMQAVVFHSTAGWAVGASGAVTAVIIVFVLHFPHRTVLLMFVLPVPAWVIGALIIGSNLMLALQPGTHIAWDAHLAGALCGLIFYRYHLTLFSFLPGGWLPKLKRRVQRAKFRVVHEPDDEDLDEQVDHILEKISRHGTASLTDEEQRVLEAASRRAQRRRGVRSD